jgi:serine-type D-Ala-D-Ala carboxypeptidase (penicillin-binding protein 5/6)
VSDPHSAPLVVAPFQLDSLRAAAGADLLAQENGAGKDAGNGSAPEERGRRGSHSRRRRSGRSHRWLLIALACALIVAGAASFVGVRLAKPDPLPVVRSVLPRSVDVTGKSLASTLPWPATGEGAVAVPALGIDVAPANQQVVPIASLTKLMTAYIILRDHPLAPGAPGPSITVIPADVQDYDLDTVSDDSNAFVQAGEVLTEREVLGGMLVHSADNLADLFARWDAGTIPAFIAKMNATARTLGMDHSHFADASGISAQSESTASDILKVAALDMQDPNVRAMVKMPDVTLPMAGTIRTYTPLLGLQGILGVKSGFTTAAGGCDVVAVVRAIHGVPVMLLAAVTSQQGPNVLAVAGLHGLALVNAVGPLIGTATVLHKGQLVAHVTSAGGTVTATASSSVTMLTWPGTTATRVFHPVHRLTDQARRGARVGTVAVTLGGQQVLVPVRLTQDTPRKSLLQRIF